MRAGLPCQQGPVVPLISAYQHEVGNSVIDLQAGGVELVPDVLLDRFLCVPGNPVSTGPLTLEIGLQSIKPIRLTRLCVLIYSAFDARVAILDLGDRLPGNERAQPNRLGIVCRVKRLNLVEGDYRLGIYISAGGEQRNVYDLLKLEIAPRPVVTGALIPYPAQYRGVLELDFDVHFA